MKIRKILFSLVFVVFGATMALADEPVLRIGVFEPLTGAYGSAGQLVTEGVQLAHSHQDHVLGRKVELVVKDNKSDPEATASAVGELVEKDKVSALIGGYTSGLTSVGAEIAEKARIPLMADSATHPMVTKNKRYVFRICFIDPYQGAAAAQYALNSGLRNAAILVEKNTPYSLGLGTFFQQAFGVLGGNVRVSLTYTEGDEDFAPQLQEIMEKDTEVLFVPAYFNEGVAIIRQARAMGADFLIIGGDGLDNPNLVSLAGDAAEDFTFTTSPYSPEMPDMSQEARDFTNQWNRAHPDKTPNANAARGYDCYMLLMDAIERAHETNPKNFDKDPSKAIAEALEKTEAWKGVTGSITINTQHDAEKPVGIKVIQKGVPVYVESVSPRF